MNTRQQVLPLCGEPLPPQAPVVIPAYLEQTYWWAYVHPRAVSFFEREWLVNLILLGNYGVLRDAALDAMGTELAGRTLQVACVYGDLTPRLRLRLAEDACLNVVDVLPIQLRNLRAKLPPDPRIALLQRDSTALGFADGSVDRALLFFLLHEQPEHVRRRTLSEVLRVLKPGGTLIVVDYHRPHRWNPLRLLMGSVLRGLEPYAMDLWRQEIETFLPPSLSVAGLCKLTFFGGLYQMVVVTR
jgi:ubiquinone/menaquinone biosynthesis C-methylase UbiE